jgi:hypothetical protein
MRVTARSMLSDSEERRPRFFCPHPPVAQRPVSHQQHMRYLPSARLAGSYRCQHVSANFARCGWFAAALLSPPRSLQACTCGQLGLTRAAIPDWRKPLVSSCPCGTHPMSPSAYLQHMSPAEAAGLCTMIAGLEGSAVVLGVLGRVCFGRFSQGSPGWTHRTNRHVRRKRCDHEQTVSLCSITTFSSYARNIHS